MGVIEREPVNLSEIRRLIWALPLLDSERHILEALWVYGSETQTCFASSDKIRAKAGSFRCRNRQRQGQEDAKNAPISRSGYYAALKGLESAGLIAERQQCGPGKAAAYALVDPRSLSSGHNTTQAARSRRITAKMDVLTAKRNSTNWTASGQVIGQQTDRTYIESKDGRCLKDIQPEPALQQTDQSIASAIQKDLVEKSFSSSKKNIFSRHREDRKTMLRSKRKSGPPGLASASQDARKAFEILSKDGPEEVKVSLMGFHDQLGFSTFVDKLAGDGFSALRGALREACGDAVRGRPHWLDGDIDQEKPAWYRVLVAAARIIETDSISAAQAALQSQGEAPVREATEEENEAKLRDSDGELVMGLWNNPSLTIYRLKSMGYEPSEAKSIAEKFAYMAGQYDETLALWGSYERKN